MLVYLFFYVNFILKNQNNLSMIKIITKKELNKKALLVKSSILQTKVCKWRINPCLINEYDKNENTCNKTNVNI